MKHQLPALDEIVAGPRAGTIWQRMGDGQKAGILGIVAVGLGGFLVAWVPGCASTALNMNIATVAGVAAMASAVLSHIFYQDFRAACAERRHLARETRVIYSQLRAG